MTMSVAIIADDLSGGIALGAEFRRVGLSTAVVEGGLWECEDGPGGSVLVVNTDSRADPVTLSIEKNRMATEAVARRAPGWIIKKLDSLLRGHIGSDVEAVLSASGQERCVIIPASPRSGRTTINGRQWVSGKPISRQMEIMDGNSGHAMDDVAAVLALETQLPIRLIPLDVVKRGVAVIAAFIRDCGEPLLIADAETQEDLNRVVIAASQEDIRLFAGTYGLGEAIVVADAVCRKSAPILAIAGSTSMLTRWQVIHAVAESGCAVVTMKLDGRDLACSPAAAAARYRDMLVENVTAGRDVILRTYAQPEDPAFLWKIAADAGWSREKLIRHVEQCVVEIVRPVLPRIGGVVISGGATASSVFRAIGATRFTVEGPEVLPASPLIRVTNGMCDGLLCLTKPGSFGKEEDLLEMMRFLSVRCVQDEKDRPSTDERREDT